MKIAKNILGIFIFFQFFIFSNKLISQGISIGEWRDHLPYNDCISVTESDDIIYCATKYDLFSYNKTDNSLQRLTKINILSDIGVTRICFSNSLKILVIAYKNGNIDLLQNETLTNISDIKRKLIPGNKSINNILFVGNIAYLSCGFGIIALDLDKKEIKDTYYIGENGAHIEIFDITTDGTKLYAATESGVYEADLNNPNLSDYQSWTKHNEMPYPDEKYNAIEFFNNKLFVNYSSILYNNDTLLIYDGNTWTYFDKTFTNNTHSINSTSNKLIVINNGDVCIYDTLLTNIHKIWNYYPGTPYPRDAIIDKDNNVWIADLFSGLVKNWDGWNNEKIKPNGPSTANVMAMSVEGSNLWVAPGGHDDTWNNIYNREGVFSFIDEQWTTLDKSIITDFDTISDFISTCVNPSNPSNAFAGSWSKGLVEFNNNSFTKLYDETNSSLEYFGTQQSHLVRIGGICFDNDGNLWVTNSEVNTALHVRKPDGTWKAFNFSGYVNGEAIGSVIVDKNNQKWIIVPRDKGLLVFNDNNTLLNSNDDKIKKINNSLGNGNLPSANIFSIACDLDGEIWVGTDKGVAVFYNPENVFSGNNFDSQQILVDQDGFYQPLLESEIVTAIAVDGANKKWIGTQRAGVFLMSADGTEELEHFTEENSPLFSNSIFSIAIDQLTGEVFFGTNKGIISYKGTATKGEEVNSDVLVYPNPVTENFNGLIAIKGLVNNADIKITDITGNLIYQTIAEGGQAVWNGKNFNGEKAKTGVYLVFASNNDGSETIVTKIMFIN